MRCLVNSHFLLVVLAALSAAHTVPVLGEQPIQVVTIRIADYGSCLVEDKNVRCAEIAAHLRNVLKVAEGSHVRILPDKAASYEATAKVVEQLQKSGLKLKLGYVNVSESSKD